MELAWPKWAEEAAPLFERLFEKCHGNYRVNIGQSGDQKIEVSLILTPQNVSSVASVAKRSGLM